MKKAILLSFLCLLLLPAQTSAQLAPQPQLELSSRQTTSLVFPYPILSVDRGSADILAQVPEQSTNVLQVKGARENFPRTNLTVITSDGRLYGFPVRYAASPAVTLLSLDAPLSPPSVLLPGDRLNEKQFTNIAQQLASDTRFCRGIRDRDGGIIATLEGIYTTGNTLIYRLVLRNASSLPFELESVRFAARDRQQARRTATQEVEQPPYYTRGTEGAVVAAGGSAVLFFALDRFPLGKGKEQIITLHERNDARQLTLRLRDRHLLQASTLLFD